MKVVWVSLTFAADASPFDWLVDHVDLTVCGPSLFDRGAPGGNQNPRYEVVKLAPLPRSRWHRLAWIYRGVSDLLDEIQPDVVHIVCEPWGLIAVQLAGLLRRRAPILTLHTCDTMWFSPGFGSEPKQWLRRKLARYTLSQTQGLAAESAEAIRQSFMGGLSQTATTALIHTNPRDPELFRPAISPEERTRDRQAMNLPTEGVGIGFLGRFLPEKGPLLFLEALQASGLLTSDLGEVWAAIAGRGPLEAEIERSSTSTGAHFLGALDWAEVPIFYRSIDILVVPSWKTDSWEEQSPRTIIEALLSGCVVVGSDSGAIPSMIGEHGVVVEEKDVDELVSGLRQAIQLHKTDIGDRARASAIERYSGSREAERLLSFWRTCIDQQIGQV